MRIAFWLLIGLVVSCQKDCDGASKAEETLGHGAVCSSDRGPVRCVMNGRLYECHGTYKKMACAEVAATPLPID